MTQQTVLKHTVKQGERWDNLAYYYYGNALDFERIINANPHIGLCEVSNLQIMNQCHRG